MMHVHLFDVIVDISNFRPSFVVRHISHRLPVLSPTLCESDSNELLKGLAEEMLPGMHKPNLSTETGGTVMRTFKSSVDAWCMEFGTPDGHEATDNSITTMNPHAFTDHLS